MYAYLNIYSEKNYCWNIDKFGSMETEDTDLLLNGVVEVCDMFRLVSACNGPIYLTGHGQWSSLTCNKCNIAPLGILT